MERDQAIKFVHELLRAMVAKKASDLFITAGFPPAFKMDGKMTPVSNQTLTTQHTQELARALMNDKQAQEFEGSKECNFAISPPGIGRFRVNAFVQQNKVSMVLRTITTRIPNFDEMGLPPVLKEVVMSKRGLVMLVGGIGLLAVSLAYTEALSRYGSPELVRAFDQTLQSVHDQLGAVPRPTAFLLGFPALAWGVSTRARRRQGWWVCAFGVAVTSPSATRLVAQELSPTSVVLGAIYSILAGVALGYVVIRVEQSLTGTHGRRARRDEEAEAHRPEPGRFEPLH